jgi:hypothetical protein
MVSACPKTFHRWRFYTAGKASGRSDEELVYKLDK